MSEFFLLLSTSSPLSSDFLVSSSRRDMAMAIAASFLFRAIGQVLGVSLAFAAQQWVLERALVERLGDAPGEVSSVSFFSHSSLTDSWLINSPFFYLS